MSTLAHFLLIILLAGIGPLLAQNGGRTDSSRATSTIDNTPPGTLNPEPLPPLANPNASNLPAKELFARKVTPLPGPVLAVTSMKCARRANNAGDNIISIKFAAAGIPGSFGLEGGVGRKKIAGSPDLNSPSQKYNVILDRVLLPDTGFKKA